MEHFLETWAKENPRLVSEEELIIEVIEKIWEATERQGFSKGAIDTQLDDDITLRKIANIASDLGMKAHFYLEPKGE